jgi:hypothetical protein
MSNDPIDQLRDELLGRDAASAEQVDAQRARLDAAMRTAVVVPARRHPIRRWLPASGFAVAALAVAALVAVALLPSDHEASRSSRKGANPMPTGLYLTRAVAGGAFARINVAEASAADVLHAAGVGATAGIPAGADRAGWAYTRIVQHLGHGTSTTERWTSPDAERSFSISVNDDGIHPPRPWIHYEHLRDGTTGDVNWVASDRQAPGRRRATWTQDKPGSNASLERMVRLHDALRAASSADDVSDALSTTLDADHLDFRDGMACDGPKGGCESIGTTAFGTDISAAESRTMYENGLLVQALATDVFPPAATRGIYDFLAAVPGIRTEPTKDGSGVVLRYRLRSGKQQEIELATLDARTGRIVEWSSIASRYDAIGFASGPVVGGELCPRYAEACGELSDLARRLEQDPKAQFRGVLDWMAITTFCDGLTDRDGSPLPDHAMPLSASKDPKVKAERAACEQREAAAAQAH